MTTFTPARRAQLDGARDRKKAARDKLVAAREAVRIATEHDDPGAATHAQIALEQARGEESLAIELESALIHQIAHISGASAASESFMSDPDMIRKLEGWANSSQPIGNEQLGLFMSAQEFADTLGPSQTLAASGPVTLPDQVRYERPYGIVRQLYRPTFLLDLIPAATMDGLAFTYVRESGSLDSGAAETNEGALKPEETGLDLSQLGTVEAVTVAAWKKLQRQSLDDLAGLGTMINSRLSYLIQRRIESQVVNGDGTGGNILGVLATTGIGSIPFDAATPASDLVLQGLTAVRLSNAQPDGILLNPTTYATMLAQKASGSGERLDSGGAFDSPADAIWGVPVIQSAIVDQTKAIVADWGRATTLYIRQGPNVRMSDSDQDDFIRNVVTVLAESRVGLMVAQPSAICEINLA